MNRILVVGYGSIGARHARLLAAAGGQVACVTRNTDCPHACYDGVAAGITAFAPTHIVVSNETARHAGTLADIAAAGWRGPVLVEKPLFDEASGMIPSGLEVTVAFNLRFHPLVLQLHERIAERAIFSADFYVGQHLADWRPGTDYRKSYSASRVLGGGVLRDLSHEIDLVQFLCGPLNLVAALGGHFSKLEISSDDVYHVLGRAERCSAVSIMLNYLDRPARRMLRLSGDGFTATLDFIKGRLEVEGAVTEIALERDATYIAQIADFLAGRTSIACPAELGAWNCKVVAAAERSAATGVFLDPAQAG